MHNMGGNEIGSASRLSRGQMPHIPPPKLNPLMAKQEFHLARRENGEEIKIEIKVFYTFH